MRDALPCDEGCWLPCRCGLVLPRSFGQWFGVPSVMLHAAPPHCVAPAQALEGRYRGITNAWRWVQANKGRFRGQVLGPIAVEVDCPDPQHVRYLEQSVNGEGLGREGLWGGGTGSLGGVWREAGIPACRGVEPPQLRPAPAANNVSTMAHPCCARCATPAAQPRPGPSSSRSSGRTTTCCRPRCAPWGERGTAVILAVSAVLAIAPGRPGSAAAWYIACRVRAQLPGSPARTAASPPCVPPPHPPCVATPSLSLPPPQVQALHRQLHRRPQHAHPAPPRRGVRVRQARAQEPLPGPQAQQCA